MQHTYCHSRYQAARRHTREVKVGNVGIGGSNPIRVQSMTTTNTEDVAATVKQTLALAEAGCEIVRITAPSKRAARALQAIRQQVNEAGYKNLPLVADIHFLPSAAMEAIEHVDKVRVNPGNYADKKRFKERDYTDSEYQEELDRLHEAFSPLVLRAKELGKSLRIGTNHGSLSDRIMNRYGDTPHGMVESALEFIRIAESHNFKDIILSMKASNPKVMIQAYRLVVARMLEEDMHYPLHLGVTEAGDGEDARVKSAIGIGALLYDGLGDTIRVSLTEDPVHEIPVAKDLAARAHILWQQTKDDFVEHRLKDSVSPYDYERRDTIVLALGKDCTIAALQPPRVITKAQYPLSDYRKIASDVIGAHNQLRESRIEGLLLTLDSPEELAELDELRTILKDTVRFYLLNAHGSLKPGDLEHYHNQTGLIPIVQYSEAHEWTAYSQAHSPVVISCEQLPEVESLRMLRGGRFIFTLSTREIGEAAHAVGRYRLLAEHLKTANYAAPLWLRSTPDTLAIGDSRYYSAHLLEASMLIGTLLCDGLGDIVSIETEESMTHATALAYNILQGTRTRITRTEYVACPSCGRTLFNLEETTQKIRKRTDHLKGVTIAVMGCIVNGPGEMADADFGYVGGAPGKINLYVGKECVKTGIPEEEAVERLIDLIRDHGKWIEQPLS